MNSPLSPEAPLVALVGRPNVGKSTLFNALIGERRSITDAMPGVTRDPVAVPWKVGGKDCRLVDTGGLQVQGPTELDAWVTRKSLEQVEKAALVLLLLDLGDFTPEDEEWVARLRPHHAKTLLVVNKLDTPEKEQQLWNFFSLGFEDVVGISSAHRRNLDLLEEKIALRLPELEVEPEAEPDIRIAVLGKPNAGKSTLVNRLTGQDLSLVSPIPGTTRDVVEGRFESGGRTYRIVDTAGIRRKAKVTEDVEYYSVNRAIASIKEADVVILLIDAVEGLSDQDKKIAAQITKEGRGLILALNKWDLLPRVGNQVDAVKDRVRFLFPVVDYAPFVPLSAKTGEGEVELLKAVSRVHRQLHQKIETPRLNELVKAWIEDQPLPAAPGQSFKIRYVTQFSVKPLRFAVFVNRMKGFPQSYLNYLKNRLRKDLGFKEVPLELELRA